MEKGQFQTSSSRPVITSQNVAENTANAHFLSDAPPDFDSVVQNQLDIPSDLPPGYAPLDPNPTSFAIAGTLIYTPAGPFYQLSRVLDRQQYQISIRRLNPADVTQLQAPGTKPLAYEKSGSLYNITDGPYSKGVLELEGLRKHTLPGKLFFKRGLRGMKVSHQRGASEPVELFNVKMSMKAVVRGKAMALEWKDASGVTLAVEGTEGQNGSNEHFALNLTQSLDPTMRDTLVACWVARIWQACAVY